MTNYEELISTVQSLRDKSIEEVVTYVSCDFCKYIDICFLSDNTMNCVDELKDWLNREVEE